MRAFDSFPRRSRRSRRLAAQVVRGTSLCVLYGERFAHYATGRERALLRDLQEFSRLAVAFQRALSADGESRRAALLALTQVHERVLERATGLNPESRLYRELRKTSRPLAKIAAALPRRSTQTHARRAVALWPFRPQASKIPTSK